MWYVRYTDTKKKKRKIQHEIFIWNPKKREKNFRNLNSQIKYLITRENLCTKILFKLSLTYFNDEQN